MLERGTMADEFGTVEFRARFHAPASVRVATLHEVSEFVRVEHQWAYLDGIADTGVR